MAKLYVAFLGVVFLAITWSASRQASDESRLRRQEQEDDRRFEAEIEAEHARGAWLALQDGDTETAEWHARWYGRPVVEGLGGTGRSGTARNGTAGNGLRDNGPVR